MVYLVHAGWTFEIVDVSSVLDRLLTTWLTISCDVSKPQLGH